MTLIIQIGGSKDEEGETEMRNVRWLHVSDIHMNKRGVDNHRMRQKLLEYLNSGNMKFDYIFLTGDLRYAPEGDFDENTAAYLKELCATAGVELCNLFIVPGNHDIERDHALRCKAAKSLFENEKKYDSKVGVIHESILADLKAGREQFLAIIREIYADYPDRIAYYESKELLHFCVETEAFNVVHIDSTISYTKERQREFVLGTEQVMKALEQANPRKTTILLTHYSSDFLTRSEQKVLQNLLMDYHAQLWIAGHEHDDLLRKQRDYFYEFQCGNLIYEGADTRSCIAVGEYDTATRKGSVQLHYWDSPNGWALYPFASNQENPSVYKFELMDNAAITEHVATVVQSEVFQRISEHECIFNIKDITEEKVRYLEEHGFLEVKKEMGARLTGDESKQDVIQMFLYEMTSSFNSGKRFECMPLFQNVVRDVFDCYIYLDAAFAPFMKARVTHFFYDIFDKFIIDNETLHIEVTTAEGKIAYITFSYNLSCYDTAEERLYHFNKIKCFISSKQVFIKMNNYEQYNLSYDTALPSDEWNQNVEKTDFWIEQMKAIVKIEEYFDIRFKLPVKASEDDYLTIAILNDSVEHKSVRILPELPMKSMGLRKQFHLEDDIYIDDGSYLPSLHLFGYDFYPTAQYLLKGDYYWNRKKKSWVAKNRREEGVPIWVAFALGCPAS